MEQVLPNNWQIHCTMSYPAVEVLEFLSLEELQKRYLKICFHVAALEVNSQAASLFLRSLKFFFGFKYSWLLLIGVWRYIKRTRWSSQGVCVGWQRWLSFMQQGYFSGLWVIWKFDLLIFGNYSGPNPHMGHLAWADAFIITADSVSMLSEACSTG